MRRPDDYRTRLSRRHFLGLGAVLGTGAAATRLATAPPAGEPAGDAAATRAAGYRETAHVREYYRKARF
ncbi:MAG: formate dehydrogenase [Gammaproteobacteria bacterium]